MRAETPWLRRSRPCRGRAPPWPSTPLLAASIAMTKGSPRSARMRRARRHPCLRRRSSRRRASPPSPSPPLPVSLTRGPSLSASWLRRESSLGRWRASWAAPVCSRAAVTWAGPAVAECFSDFILLFISQIYVHLEKYVAPSI